MLVLLGSPKIKPVNQGFMAVSAFVLLAFSCCKTLQASSSEFNELPGAAIHSTQHERNTALPASFALEFDLAAVLFILFLVGIGTLALWPGYHRK